MNVMRSQHRSQEIAPELRFQWGIPHGGYVWDTKAEVAPYLGRTGSMPPFLIPGRIKTKSKPYRPMEDIPDLYLKFAALRDAPDLQDAILRFANQYGWLGLWGPLHYPDLKEQVLFRGEALSTWEEEIGTLATILELWEGVKFDDLGRLRTYVYWRNDNRSVELVIDIPKAQLDERVKKIVRRQQAKLLGRISKGNFIPSYRLLANVVNTEVEWFQKQRPGDLIEPAKLAICKIVNEKLTGKCSPRVLLEDDGSIGRYLTPNSLLAAMWLQTRELVTGRKRFVECKRCGQRLDTTEGRTTKRWCKRCSQYLRTKRWREKKREKKQHAKKKTRSKRRQHLQDVGRSLESCR